MSLLHSSSPGTARSGTRALRAAILALACLAPASVLRAEGSSAATIVALRVGGDPVPGAGGAAARAAAKVHRKRVRVAKAALRYGAPRSETALAEDLGVLLRTRSRGGRWGVMVVSLTRGDTLYQREAGRELLPASTMKLFTTAFALDRFGPDHQFSTDVLRAGPLAADGTVLGDLVLRGDGDPGLSNRFYRGQPGEPMDLLARFVAGAGIRHVTGDLIADASAFDDGRIPKGWLRRYLHASYAAPVSALSLNENLASVVVRPGAAGKPAVVTLEPASSAWPVVSTVRTIDGRAGARVSVRRGRDGRVEASGWIGSRSGARSVEMIVDDPATFTAGAFRAALAAQGIVVDGTIRVATAPEGATVVASLPSAPLARLIAVMNRESINHFAELLFRDASRGKEGGAPGSATSGAEQMKDFLAGRAGVDPDEIDAADGSGLSTFDRVTPRAMVKLLGYSHAAPWSSAFHASLPVAGESELLRHRMQWTPAQGNLHAKTGTTNAVASLGGYVTAQNGEVLAFAFIYNGGDRWNAKRTMDAMGATLAGFSRE
jgi:D-alanyl-D-alanine carboxypeptidase/D-alanyl-D-alanine-endopeptidase (penicillin-binding protein 4)